MSILQPSTVPVKRKSRQHPLPRSARLLLPEGHAVGALIHGGVAFVGAHQDPVQRTEILVLAVISALMDGALDALVGIAVHNKNASF